METNLFGNIQIRTKGRSRIATQALILVLLCTTIYAFYSFDYKDVNLAEALADTWHNIGIVFFQPRLSRDTIAGVLYQLLVTFCLGMLSTLFGAILAFVCALFCASNISSGKVAVVIKSIVSVARAVPTVLWVLIFAVSAGLGSVAAVIGLTFHSFAYLTKVYAETIEEIEEGTIEALKASGAGFFQIVCQAVVPASLSSMVAWTFMRFEINFTNAVAMGAAAGAGGIGYNLYMAGSFYFDLHEMGLLTYVVVLAVFLLEMVATRIKRSVK